MKCNLFFILLLFCAPCAFAQNRMGLDLGVGVPAFSGGSGSQNSSTVANYQNNAVFTGQVYYLRKIARHLYFGAKASYEEYSFTFTQTQNDGQGGTMGTVVSQTSSYLHVGPMLDVGVGRKREYLHGFVYATAGLLMTGDQTTRNYHQNFGLPGSNFDDTYVSDSKINSAIFRIGFGLKQQLPLSKTWYANFTEGYSFMPFTDLTDPSAAGGADLHPGYFTFMFGVMHKFKDMSR